MEIGDIALLTSFEHHFSNPEVRGRVRIVAPKDRYIVAILIGDTPKKKINDVDPVKMLEALGWKRKRRGPYRGRRKKR